MQYLSCYFVFRKKTMNVEVDKDLCIGCGFCASTMPSVFELDDDGLSQVIKKENEEENTKEDILEVAEGCPTNAILVEEENEKE